MASAVVFSRWAGGDDDQCPRCRRIERSGGISTCCGWWLRRYVFPAESVGMMAGTSAAAGSSGAAFQAASSVVRPPPAIAFASDDHKDYQVRRMLVDSCFCAVILASVFTVLTFRYCVTHVGSAGRPHSLYSRSLLFSSGSFLLVLFCFLLYLDRTADDYPAVESHRGGGCDCDAVVIVML